MAEASVSPKSTTPVWFWVVAVLAVLFNSGGVMNYLTMQLAPDAMMAQMTAEQQAYFNAFPAWYVAVYALTTHLSLIAAVLLLLRRAWAVPAFAAACALYALSLVYHYVLSGAAGIMGAGANVFSAVIGLQLVALFLLARWAKAQGVLR